MACHLDLSQWATLDVWGKLSSNQKKALISTSDLELLGEIIKNVQTFKWKENFTKNFQAFEYKAPKNPFALDN